MSTHLNKVEIRNEITYSGFITNLFNFKYVYDLFSQQVFTQSICMSRAHNNLGRERESLCVERIYLIQQVPVLIAEDCYSRLRPRVPRVQHKYMNIVNTIHINIPRQCPRHSITHNT